MVLRGPYSSRWARMMWFLKDKLPRHPEEGSVLQRLRNNEEDEEFYQTQWNTYVTAHSAPTESTMLLGLTGVVPKAKERDYREALVDGRLTSAYIKRLVGPVNNPQSLAYLAQINYVLNTPGKVITPADLQKIMDATSPTVSSDEYRENLL